MKMERSNWEERLKRKNSKDKKALQSLVDLYWEREPLQLPRPRFNDYDE